MQLVYSIVSLFKGIVLLSYFNTCNGCKTFWFCFHKRFVFYKILSRAYKFPGLNTEPIRLKFLHEP